MQASKIRVKSVYAIRAENGELQRFRVTAVVQRRIDNTGSPHDYKSYVEGVVSETSNPDLAAGERAIIALHPDRILGPFEDFSELEQRRKVEEAAVKAEKEAFKNANLELRAMLYKIVDLPMPNDTTNYRQPFPYTTGSVDISREAVVPLLNALRALVKERATSQ